MVELKQQYHLETNRGLLNDPNGLTYFQGKYYVFFQWNRFKKDHSYKEWGYFISEDFVTWKFQGSALLPDQIYDMNGVYSGSAYVISDKLYLFYTGNVKIDGKRKSCQCLAISEDGEKFLKKGVILETPQEYTEHFRDPKVLKGNKDGYFMVVGGQRKNGKGAIALCYSKDGMCWEYTNILARTEEYEMIECPDLFRLDKHDVLLFCSQKRDNTKDIPLHSFAAYKIGDFNEISGVFSDGKLDIGYRYIDYGFDFYAPQTFLTIDGRRVLFAWMSRMEGEQEELFSAHTSNIHCLTLPRELSISNGRLYQRPIRELYQMIGEEVEVVKERENRKTAYPCERAFYLKVDSIDSKKNMNVEFHHGEAKLEYDSSAMKMKFLRRNWLTNMWEFREVLIKNLNDIEIWSDHSSIEIFINDGMVVLSSRIFPNASKPEIILEGLGEYTAITIHEFKIKRKEEGEQYE